MSNIAMQGGATGTGTVTLLAPVTNTNRTINLPDSNGTIVTSATAGVPINGPAFSAYPSSNQSITTSTFTKILFQNTDFDVSNGAYSSSRFTPTVAGYYQVQVSISPNTATTATQACIYKNGALNKRQFSSLSNAIQFVSALVYLNGATDYIEGWGYLTGVTPALAGVIDQTYFQAALIRSAV